MAFTHYPKLDAPSLVHLCRFGDGDPRNTAPRLDPGDALIAYRHCVNFTRFYGSIWAPEPLDVVIAFANDLAVKKSDRPIPENLESFHEIPGSPLLRIPAEEDWPYLHYDAEGTRVHYRPSDGGKPPVGDKLLVTIYGTFMRMSVRFTGAAPLEEYRVSLVGSVF